MLCGQGAEEECVEDVDEADMKKSATGPLATMKQVAKILTGTLETMKQMAKELKKHSFSPVTKKISAFERMFVNQQSV